MTTGSFGQTRAMSFASGGSRQDILGRKYQPFSNPFFDQASTYMPPTIKSLFGFCRYFYLTHGIIHAVMTKAAEYPLTDLILQHEHQHIVDRWEELLHGILNYRTHQFEVNLETNVYGNAFISPSFPFQKFLTCSACSAKLEALRERKAWRYTNSRFWLACPKCGNTDYAKSHDEPLQKYAELNVVRWNPENVSLTYNETTGRIDRVLDTSQSFKSQVLMGRKDLVATTPEIFLQSVKERRAIVLDPSSVFHLRRPALSSVNQGWGIPMLMPVLKDAYYMQVMKKSQECVLLTHLLPQVYLFPQPATAGADPFTTANLQNWRGQLQREIARQRMDPSYYGILPFPIGHQTIGENGRSLLLMPEIQQMAELIVTAMGFPVDLVFGQGTYAGSSVNMRMLENTFTASVQGQIRLLKWLMRQFGSFMNWPTPKCRFKPFKMADDLQRQAFNMELNARGKLSDTTLLAGSDFRIEDEAKLRSAELELQREGMAKFQAIQAEVMGKAALISAKYQAEAQQLALSQRKPPVDPFADMQSSSLAGGPRVTLDAAAAALATHIKTLTPSQQAAYMSQIEVISPGMEELVQGQMMMPEGAPQPPMEGMPGDPSGAGGGGQAGPANPMLAPLNQPTPEKLPPRRAVGGV